MNVSMWRWRFIVFSEKFSQASTDAQLAAAEARERTEKTFNEYKGKVDDAVVEYKGKLDDALTKYQSSADDTVKQTQQWLKDK